MRAFDTTVKAEFDGFRTRFWELPVAECDFLLLFHIDLMHSLHHIFYTPRVPLQNSGSQVTTIDFCRQVAKTPTYPVICPSSLFVALCDHSPSNLQTDRQTDRQTDVNHASGISATCIFFNDRSETNYRKIHWTNFRDLFT